jgi:hypothetical protein
VCVCVIVPCYTLCMYVCVYIGGRYYVLYTVCIYLHIELDEWGALGGIQAPF